MKLLAALWLVSFALLALAVPAAAQTVESAYTELDLKRCQHNPGAVAEDYGEWFCEGYRGMPVRVGAGDQRVTVSYGNRAKEEPAATQTLERFNGVGGRIEWRIAPNAQGNKRAFATIVRWSTTATGADGKPVRGEMLVVTRIGIAGVCHVGYVDGRNAKANELARQIADQYAREFICRRDKPVVLGDKGPGLSAPYDFGGR